MTFLPSIISWLLRTFSILRSVVPWPFTAFGSSFGLVSVPKMTSVASFTSPVRVWPCMPQKGQARTGAARAANRATPASQERYHAVTDIDCLLRYQDGPRPAARLVLSPPTGGQGKVEAGLLLAGRAARNLRLVLGEVLGDKHPRPVGLFLKVRLESFEVAAGVFQRPGPFLSGHGGRV